jgi:hypothetical protein
LFDQHRKKLNRKSWDANDRAIKAKGRYGRLRWLKDAPATLRIEGAGYGLEEVLATDGMVLVAWEHGAIIDMANRLLGDEKTAPQKWPDSRFDLVWVFDRRSHPDGWMFAQVAQRLCRGMLGRFCSVGLFCLPCGGSEDPHSVAVGCDGHCSV